MASLVPCSILSGFGENEISAAGTTVMVMDLLTVLPLESAAVIFSVCVLTDKSAPLNSLIADVPISREVFPFRFGTLFDQLPSVALTSVRG